MKRYIILTALLTIAAAVNAQSLRGTIYEEGTSQKLPNVFIKNTNNKQLSLADDNGKFTIPAANGNIVIFYSPGYVSDTLFVTDVDKSKRIELKSLAIALKEVSITDSRKNFNPRVEYPEVYTRSKVYVLSPSTWFSAEGRNARRLKKYFAREEQERQVDEVYTKSYVGSIVPLKGEELSNFMLLYRPTYEYVKNNNGPSIAVFINDSYQKYKALPADQRKLPELVAQ
jgi:hypothetical protein